MLQGIAPPDTVGYACLHRLLCAETVCTMSQTVLVTGATGYIALEICKQLLTAGEFKVRGTVRSLANEKRNKPLLDLVPSAEHKIELVEADLLSAGGWEKAIEGVDFVLHTASPFFVAGKREGEQKLVKPAVEGTLNVLRACAAEGSSVPATSAVPFPVYCQRRMARQPQRTHKWRMNGRAFGERGLPRLVPLPVLCAA